MCQNKCGDIIIHILHCQQQPIANCFYLQLFFMRFNFQSTLHSVSSYIIYETSWEFLQQCYLKKIYKYYMQNMALRQYFSTQDSSAYIGVILPGWYLQKCMRKVSTITIAKMLLAFCGRELKLLNIFFSSQDGPTHFLGTVGNKHIKTKSLSYWSMYFHVV